MTLTKKQMVREIGRRTRLKNRDVQMMLETLFEVWTEELVEGSGRIELEGLFVLESLHIDLGATTGVSKQEKLMSRFRRVTLRSSRALRQRLRT